MIFEILILVLAIPSGFLISEMAKDELKSGKRWFGFLMIASILGMAWFWLIGAREASWASAFILVFTFVSFYRSNNFK